MEINDAYKQLEYARKLRLHQDLLRFAIPTAYLTFLGAAAGVIVSNSATFVYLYLLSAFIGTGIFVATLTEHYFYASFRNWEHKLECVLFEPELPHEPQEEGDYGNPNSDTKPIKRFSEGKIIQLQAVITFANARSKYPDVSKPNLSHGTMTILLLWVSGMASIQYSIFLGKILPSLNEIALFSVGLLITTVHLSVYKRWHTFYRRVVGPLLKSLKTT